MTGASGEGARVGIDVGGTFTDLVHLADDRVTVAKVASTPQDQSQGILDALDRADVDIASLRRFVHGTTVATNTVLERDGARCVLVTTRGFGDLLHLARQDRPHLYRLDARRPGPLVPRERVVEVAERTEADGTVSLALTDAEVARVTSAVAALTPEAVAISLLFGFLAPDHEARLAEAIDDLGIPVTRASALLPVLREVERTSTTVLNAYLGPRMARYLGGLEERLRARGLDVPVEVMRSGGGTATAAVAAREPVRAVLSGPAAGAWGAAALGRALGDTSLIAFDVGGTSTDVTLITDGTPRTTADGVVAGLPYAVTTTDLHTIGAGGGSIAWRDDGGALRVGPRSAGAEPGPACYGRGGTAATVTDANVVLGRLDPEVRLGGAMPLDPTAARMAVATLAGELGLDVPAAATGIVAVTDAAMAQALRVVSVERGHDPRGFALLPFGGAGPLHQAALAAELGCPRVLVPPHPGVLSALGLLAAPVTVDRARAHLGELSADGQAGALRRAWRELTEEATAATLAQGLADADVRLSIDLRYRGQAFELEVPADDADPAALTERFHAAHEDRYGYRREQAVVEVVTVRVRAQGPTPTLPLPPLTGGGDVAAATLARRQVRVDERVRVEAPIVDRSRLGAGARLRGPAVVVGLDATVWVAPWQQGEVEEHGILVLEEAP
ncbi:MAG: hydantoinase/oxoprolinase family protein [Nitriliruptoraceae bacterium]